MFSTAQTDTFSAEVAGYGSVVRCVGVGSYIEMSDIISPLHQCTEMSRKLRVNGRNFAFDHFSG